MRRPSAGRQHLTRYNLLLKSILIGQFSSSPKAGKKPVSVQPPLHYSQILNQFLQWHINLRFEGSQRQISHHGKELASRQIYPLVELQVMTYQEPIVAMEQIFINKKSKCPQTIVESDNDNIISLGKVSSIIITTPPLHELSLTTIPVKTV